MDTAQLFNVLNLKPKKFTYGHEVRSATGLPYLLQEVSCPLSNFLRSFSTDFHVRIKNPADQLHTR